MFQRFIADALLLGEIRPALDGSAHFDFLDRFGGGGVADMEIVFPGVCHDLLECEDAVNVPFGLFPQEEIIIVVFLLPNTFASEEQPSLSLSLPLHREDTANGKSGRVSSELSQS